MDNAEQPRGAWNAADRAEHVQGIHMGRHAREQYGWVGLGVTGGAAAGARSP
jgi:hypothetical protein